MPTFKRYILLSLDFDYYGIIGSESPMSIPSPISLPSITLTSCFSLCTTVCHMRHVIFCFLIQKRGSRKGSIEIKKIRCVEKVNVEEQTPAERQYPFQVRAGTHSIGWMALLVIFSVMNSIYLR